MNETFFQISSLPPWEITWVLFTDFYGWVPFLILVFVAAKIVWMDYIQDKWIAKQEFVLFAINIPREHTQSPKAVEQIFNTMWGMFSGPNKKEKYWEGKFQLGYSLEIVSIEGFVQFLIYLPKPFRNLVESAVYAQFPDSEILEVEDYTTYVPKEWPAEGWDLWGTEFKFTKPDPYPIRTYPHFEDMRTQGYADPLSGVLEILSKIGAGEQIWLQWVITPLSDDWQKLADKEINKMLGIKDAAKKTFVQKLFSPLGTLWGELVEILSLGLGTGGGFLAGGGATSEEAKAKKMDELSPQQQAAIKLIQEKANKIAYRTKMRMVYIGQKDNFNKPLGAAGTIGSLRTFSSLVGNAFRPEGKTLTSLSYFVNFMSRLDKRKKSILSAFRSRSQSLGPGEGMVLNVEELASLWHFPSELVRTPQLKRSQARAVEPPVELPVESIFTPIHETPSVQLSNESIPHSFQSVEGYVPEESPSEMLAPEITPVTNLEAFTGPQVIVEEQSDSSSNQSPSSSTGAPPSNLPVG